MRIYYSKSSLYVKTATISAFVLLALAIWSLFLSNNDYGQLSGMIFSLLILATIVFFYSNSLNKIIVRNDMFTLKKNFGQIQIPKTDILDVNFLRYSNLTMTYGSKGVFGFIGNTMDDCSSLVKDRKKMIQVITKSRKYIISADTPEDLVKDIKNTYEI
ncbi:PH domain-containing protein [Gelidibacter mesophilus]|uniref:PH domain-containing protein n=1 Tax=Gelidibacter mesophilus TaxID=169050 RepID=UPI0003FD5CC0|nr:PH domain-containing protein [Gelidibacter mesophilus]